MYSENSPNCPAHFLFPLVMHVFVFHSSLHSRFILLAHWNEELRNPTGLAVSGHPSPASSCPMLRNSPNTQDLTLKYPTHHLFHFCGGVRADVGVDFNYMAREKLSFSLFLYKIQEPNFKQFRQYHKKTANTLKNAALRIPYVFVWIYVWFLVGNVSHWLGIKLVPILLPTTADSWAKGSRRLLADDQRQV